MPLPLALAHQRYTQQAGWTTQLRRHIFTRAGLPNAQRVLEIGCGTGAILVSISSRRSSLFGLDIDFPSMQLAKTNAKGAILVKGNALQLPFTNGSFDISFFHFVLLWLSDPVRALMEARRATRSGGAVIAFAEPDYSRRKGESAGLARLNELQIESLRAQGADPNLGSRLNELFITSGIRVEEFGQLDPFKEMPANHDLELELQIIKDDIRPYLATEELDRLIFDLRESRALVKFHLPTYFCWGWLE